MKKDAVNRRLRLAKLAAAEQLQLLSLSIPLNMEADEHVSSTQPMQHDLNVETQVTQARAAEQLHSTSLPLSTHIDEDDTTADVSRFPPLRWCEPVAANVAAAQPYELRERLVKGRTVAHPHHTRTHPIVRSITTALDSWSSKPILLQERHLPKQCDLLEICAAEIIIHAVTPQSWLPPIVAVADACMRNRVLDVARSIGNRFDATRLDFSHAIIVVTTTDPLAEELWRPCHAILRGKPLWSQAFLGLSKANDWKLNWLLRPPLHFRGTVTTKVLLLLTHELKMGALLVPDICRALPATHPALAEMQRLKTEFGSAERIASFRMRSGNLFSDWLRAHGRPDKHSTHAHQYHAREAYHVCTAANGLVVRDKKHGDDPGTVRAIHSAPSDGLWQDAMDTFLHPLLAALQALRVALPEEVRPVWVNEMYDVQSTGCSYVGLNITPSKCWGLDQFTWEGTFDPKTGRHHGIHVHRDHNNARKKMGYIAVLGHFDGFNQLLLPYGTSIACPHMGVLLADTSDVLHAVSEGTGCRVSVVVCNHEFVETGIRRCDGKILVQK